MASYERYNGCAESVDRKRRMFEYTLTMWCFLVGIHDFQKLSLLTFEAMISFLFAPPPPRKINFKNKVTATYN